MCLSVFAVAPTPEAVEDGPAASAGGRARGRASKRNKGPDGGAQGEAGTGAGQGSSAGGGGGKPTVAALEALVDKASHILVQMPEVCCACVCVCVCVCVWFGFVGGGALCTYAQSLGIACQGL